MGDFIRVGLPNLICPKRGNRNRLPVQRHELDFASPAFAMYEHDSADVSGRELLLRQIEREHDFVTFANHSWLALAIGFVRLRHSTVSFRGLGGRSRNEVFLGHDRGTSLYGYTIDRTQRIAQSLYDKKLITYPRTESQHLRPEDDVEMVRERLAQIAAGGPELSGPARAALALGVDPANKRVFDSDKVGDHFAIIPAEPPPELPALRDDEHKIYNFILRRFVTAFLAPSETIVHTLTFTVADETFLAVTRSIRVPGWRAVDGKSAEALAVGPEGKPAFELPKRGT